MTFPARHIARATALRQTVEPGSTRSKRFLCDRIRAAAGFALAFNEHTQAMILRPAPCPLAAPGYRG